MEILIGSNSRRCIVASCVWVVGMIAFGNEGAESPQIDDLRLIEQVNSISIRRGNKAVLVYNKQSPPVPAGMDPRYNRSGFLHPVASPSGRVVTATFPIDHPHQHGIFSAWVNTTFDGRKIDFWNLVGGTGRVVHEKVISTTDDARGIGFEVDLLHRTEGDNPIDVLRERWKITLVSSSDDVNCFDIESTQTALTKIPLIVHKYHYGGMALRGPVAWLNEKQKSTKVQADAVSRFVNDHGSDRKKGNHEHAKWVSLTGKLEGQAVSITVFCHRDNFRAPQAARLHPSKPYFVFSPCVDGEFVIDKLNPHHNKYRYIVTDEPPDNACLNEQWNAWVANQ
jgi:hypothetical protein